MLKDALVTIPKNTREKPQNGNVYIYHVIESVYDPAKRYNTDKRICIGKKYNDTKMYPNDNYFKYYDLDPIVHCAHDRLPFFVR